MSADQGPQGQSLPQEPAVVRILVGVAGRSVTLMVGMAVGAVEGLAARRTRMGGQPLPPMRPVAVGVSGGAIAAAAIALGMARGEARQLAIDHPEGNVLGPRSFRALLTRRVLYPEARIRELAYAVVGDRTFADFGLDSASPGQQPHHRPSSLLIPVYSVKYGTLLLPRDLPRLGRSDLPVVDALVAATRIPGALPAAPGLEDIFDGGCQYRVPHHLFAPHPALVLDLYGPQPYDSRGGLIFPLLHPSMPTIPSRPRPFRDQTLCESTIFAHEPYGAALKPPARSSGELFDTGYDIATTWIRSRTDRQLLTVVDPHILGLPDTPDVPPDIHFPRAATSFVGPADAHHADRGLPRFRRPHRGRRGAQPPGSLFCVADQQRDLYPVVDAELGEQIAGVRLDGGDGDL
ncbi:hypothetical protein BJY24_005518 [Nocardia transvalensis]|uniref:PNPLA domain-containing protein n=1 Tax=Nocardia transvalensis TaxID=37333 RepID=A0A7W9UKL6_9NOCA|nr:patatin-like phospholipase family protein [Nocardia transvalensis]MBB5916606.1 hypothetical protein [Nocardia transvalensis]